MPQAPTNQQDLLKYLRTLRSSLIVNDDDIVHLLHNDAARLHRYELYKASLDGIVHRLENNQFAALDQQLVATAQDLQNGITALDAALHSLNNAIDLVNAFTAVVDIAVRAAAMAAK